MVQNINRILCFGDSWAAGAELKPYEQPFVHWMAQTLSVPYFNFGVQGHSLGMILHTIVDRLQDIDRNSVVIVIIPPDTRWYDQNQEQGFYSVQNYQRDDYFRFLNRKTLEWFRYHHALFIYTAQKIFADIGCQYLMAHNYGQLNEYDKYQLPIDFARFLSTQSLTDLLSDQPVGWKSYPEHLPEWHRYDQDGPGPAVFSGRYFEGCDTHPNELGHRYIAELLLEKICHDAK